LGVDFEIDWQYRWIWLVWEYRVGMIYYRVSYINSRVSEKEVKLQ
jgi:hypothetical protein